MSLNFRGNQGQQGQNPMTELTTLYDIITYLVRIVDDIFQFTFRRKKGCVIKENVANKKDNHCSTPILGQFYDKICGLMS